MEHLTTEKFIEKAHLIHGYRYIYSNVEYKNTSTPICIICPTHGEFSQTPNKHLNGHGCPKCGGSLNSTTESFIEKARKKHGDTYNYSKVSYINNRTPVCITCRIHGDFWQIPHVHLKSGCPDCGKQIRRENNRFSFDEFVRRSKKVHGGFYDYSKVVYKNTKTPVCIICPIHGEFYQRPETHMKGCHCNKCADVERNKSHTMTKEGFVRRSNEAHGGKYSYEKVVYKNSTTAVCITCQKHGDFFQVPNNHIRGTGCPICGENRSRGEDDVYNWLSKEFPSLKIERRTKKIIFPKELDLFIKEKKVAIEFNGVHWHSNFHKREKSYHLDKTIKCSELGINLIHVFDDEWRDKQTAVKNEIRRNINDVASAEDFIKNNYEVKPISKREALMFVEKFSICKFKHSTLFLGAFTNERLVAVACFKQNRTETDTWELNDFSTNQQQLDCLLHKTIFDKFFENYHVHKLFVLFDRTNKTPKVMKVFLEYGFLIEKTIKPQFFFVDKKSNKRISRFNKEAKLNELERLWDCGKFKLVFNAKN